jgi:hypothetical protein
MDIGLDKQATPYDPEQARNLFRDLLLGIEYRIRLIPVSLNKSACSRDRPSRYKA